jgi:hypothetical protein
MPGSSDVSKAGTHLLWAPPADADQEAPHVQPPRGAGGYVGLEPGALRVGVAIEADLDLGRGAYGWVLGFVTKVRPDKGTFRATFRREEDPAASVLRFAMADAGGEWRWPAASDVEAAAVAVVAPAVSWSTADAVSPCSVAMIDGLCRRRPLAPSFLPASAPRSVCLTCSPPPRSRICLGWGSKRSKLQCAGAHRRCCQGLFQGMTPGRSLARTQWGSGLKFFGPRGTHGTLGRWWATKKSLGST